MHELLCIGKRLAWGAFHGGPFAFQVELQQHLQDLLKEAGVEHVHELLSAHVAKDWPRTARVNLLKMTIAEALAWVRVPPAAHKKWAHLVCCPALPCPALPCPACTQPMHHHFDHAGIARAHQGSSAGRRLSD